MNDDIDELLLKEQALKQHQCELQRNLAEVTEELCTLRSKIAEFHGY